LPCLALNFPLTEAGALQRRFNLRERLKVQALFGFVVPQARRNSLPKINAAMLTTLGPCRFAEDQPSTGSQRAARLA